MWTKTCGDIYVYALWSHHHAGNFTELEGVYLDTKSCIETIIEILRVEYDERKEDFPENEIREEVTNRFNGYNHYWNSYVDISFYIKMSNIWKYV